MRALTLSLAMTVAIAGQASALSCMAPDIGRTFDRLDAAPETYMLFSGTLDLGAEKPVPGKNPFRGGEIPTVSHGTFKGLAFNGEGFKTPVSGEISVTTLCFGEWCGKMPGPQEHIFFIEMVGDAPAQLETSPCGGSIFAPRERDQLFEHLSLFVDPRSSKKNQENRPVRFFAPERRTQSPDHRRDRPRREGQNDEHHDHVSGDPGHPCDCGSP